MLKKWKYALCLHPMYWIIAHDTLCAEREPPWGEKTIEKYIDRCRRNLASMDAHPEVRFGFEFSAMELEDMAKRAPDVIEHLKRLRREGRMCFVNGTYSQPHLQIFGSESNYRQFKIGTETIRKIVGQRVTAYAAQEPGLNEQTPQLLRAFGYKYAQVPGFSFTIVFDGEHEILHHFERFFHLDFIHGDEFTHWKSLDGSTIPLYLSTQGDTDYENIKFEVQKDMMRSPDIVASFHDMLEVSDEWFANISEYGDFVLLDKALSDRFRECPPTSSARVYCYWSYGGEGVWAEELVRTIRRSENVALQAEAMAAVANHLTKRPAENFTDVWKTILGAQHHDACWAGGPELRRKSIGWLDERIAQCQATTTSAVEAICDRVDTAWVQDSIPIVVLNPYPAKQQDIVRADVRFPAGWGNSVELRSQSRRRISHQLVEIKRHDDQSLKSAGVLFLAESPGLGYATYALASDAKTTTEVHPRERRRDFTFENDYYKAKLRSDGTFRSLYCKAAELELLKCSQYFGNELTLRTEGGDWLSSQGMSSSMTVSAGSVFSIVRCSGVLEQTPVEMSICFYTDLPRIDFRLRFEFDDVSWGTYWLDESKLNLFWPLALDGAIHHDIAFGTVKGREERPLFAINWLDVSDQRAGLAYFNQGTVKHWVRDNVIANVLAWGHEGNQFSSRMNTHWIKNMDLRLKGTHTIEYSIFPHAGDWQKANVPDVARRVSGSLVAHQTSVHSAKLPGRQGILEIGPKNLMATSVQAVRGGLSCRLYDNFGKKTTPKLKLGNGVTNSCLESLTGENISQLNPFQIGQVRVKR